MLKLFPSVSFSSFYRERQSTVLLPQVNSKLQYWLTNDGCYITALVCLVSLAQSSINAQGREEDRKNQPTRSETLGLYCMGSALLGRTCSMPTLTISRCPLGSRHCGNPRGTQEKTKRGSSRDTQVGSGTSQRLEPRPKSQPSLTLIRAQSSLPCG